MPAVIDGCLLDDANAVIAVSDDGLLRGDGVFEVIRLYSGVPLALDEHLERMAQSGRGFRLAVSVSGFRQDIELLLDSVGNLDAFLRLVQTSGGRRITIVEELGTISAATTLATITCSAPVLMRGIKSLSYAPNMLAVRLAEEQGADDALLVTHDDIVLEASRAGFFYVLDGEIYTPPLDDGVLDSITRRHVFAATTAMERRTTRRDLDKLAEAFIASTTKGILPVGVIDGRSLEAPGAQTSAVMLSHAEYVRDRLRAWSSRSLHLPR